MKVDTITSRDEVYNAPTIPWNNGTYTPVSNKMVMDLIEDRLKQNHLIIKKEHYRTARTDKGIIKGVIGGYDIEADDASFGQRVMFRNSYDKSMSFAMVCGMVVWICENGCVSGDYQYRRIHRGAFLETGLSTTIEDIIENIDGGLKQLNAAFEHNVIQLNDMKDIDVSPKDAYQVLGELFFNQEVVSINQMSIIKKEMQFSQHFKHIGDKDFTAYDLYNHITESLKKSHPITYIRDHIKTHKLFEQTFNV